METVPTIHWQGSGAKGLEKHEVSLPGKDAPPFSSTDVVENGERKTAGKAIIKVLSSYWRSILKV